MSQKEKRCLICQTEQDILYINGLNFCKKCLNSNKLQNFFEKKIRSQKKWERKKQELVTAYETCQNVYQYKEKNEKHPFVNYIIKNISKNESILDVGCGNGWLSSLLLNKYKVIAVDISKVMIEECKKKFKNEQKIKFYNSFVEELPLENASVDNVIMFDVLEHCVDVKRVLKEINRVLKPGGQLFIVVPQLYGQIYQNLIKNYRKTGRFFQIKRYLNYFFTKKMYGNFHLHEFTRKKISKVLTESGFEYEFIRFNKHSKIKKILEFFGVNYSHTLFVVGIKK